MLLASDTVRSRGEVGFSSSPLDTASLPTRVRWFDQVMFVYNTREMPANNYNFLAWNNAYAFMCERDTACIHTSADVGRCQPTSANACVNPPLALSIATI